MSYFRTLIFCLPLALISGLATAQSTSIAFGTIKADPSLPVEVTSDTLEVNQVDGSAQFLGSVLVIQGVMRLSADNVLVIYKPEQKGIDRLEATGNVILVNGPDAAEAERAEYTIDSGTIVMNGNVLLSQGNSTLASSQMVVNLNSGTAQMSGRVKTILNPDGNN
ncbi:lipopolysaccharide transport periplasmic protein LptA [Parasedimentitalea maritima]|uniref:Lipopolysaccharide transport periplasmic protein LptA n=1 Tax=Parasedimentitalea maritima TaxID=2578117 RepID=A0A5R8ZIW5_9RHOB|nr:LptA/OstA family protein [Zongyanglinia marina]KAE9630926.1 lipopolysaccharide transport periplasmic protein LptA [Zongyanglinia marina]TLP65708.1 lipopolysaccharide transport periplasmic protein LptA [Zongyanglinia marina]